MVAWGIRAGASGEREAYALEHGLVTIGFGKLPDLGGFSGKDQLKMHLKAADPGWPDHSISVWAGQIWAFVHGVQPGDLVALPRKSTRRAALGEVSTGYIYDETAPSMARHRRSVRWLEKDVPCDALDSDLRYSLLSMLTVFQIRPPDAERRLREQIGRDPVGKCEPARAPSAETGLSPDMAAAARGAIMTLIRQRFMGHRLEELVAVILEADGYNVLRSGLGRDGGVDLVASQGLLGFGAERLVVQVKSGQRPASPHDIGGFAARLRRLDATRGLYVSMAGFSGLSRAEQRDDFFRMRYWDADALLDAVLRVYDLLPAAIRNELPLRRIWAPCMMQPLTV
jgi:restriction system protein